MDRAQANAQGSGPVDAPGRDEGGSFRDGQGGIDSHAAAVTTRPRNGMWTAVRDVQRARVRHALVTGALIGAGCGIVGALLLPNMLFVFAPAAGLALGAWYAKSPTAIDAAIDAAMERSERAGHLAG